MPAGLPVVIKALGEGGHLHKDALTVSGGPIWDEVKEVRNWNAEVIRPVEKALTASGGIAVLRGNLAPDGAVLKPSAASAHLMVHRGRAVVFEDIDDYKAKINDEALDIDETCVMVLKNCGPRGYPGMAEVGNMGLPPKVLRKGITDMVRISGRAHVGDGLRDGGAAHLARGGARRAAGGGAGRGHDQPRRAGAVADAGDLRRRSWRRGWRPGGRRWSGRTGAGTSSTTTT